MGAHPMTLARTVIGIADRGPTTSAGTAVSSALDGLAGIYETDEPGCEPIELVAAKSGPVLRRDSQEIGLQELDSDLFLAPDPAFDRFPIRVERRAGDTPELWHGGRRYVRAGVDALPLSVPSEDLQSTAGHYRSHNPWTTNFRIVLRGDQPWLIFAGAPDGFDTEQSLVADGASYRVGEDRGNPETVSFDTVVDGRALRAWLSGWPYYRAD
jgi:D-alanyl-D-alanine carboxypeptidase